MAKFGAVYADPLRKRAASPGRTWHLDEMATRIGGKLQWLWRAVDEHGQTLDVLLQKRRDTEAAGRFSRRLLGITGAPPGRIMTDTLGSDAAAIAQMSDRTTSCLTTQSSIAHRGCRRNSRLHRQRDSTIMHPAGETVHRETIPKRPSRTTATIAGALDLLCASGTSTTTTTAPGRSTANSRFTQQRVTHPAGIRCSPASRLAQPRLAPCEDRVPRA